MPRAAKNEKTAPVEPLVESIQGTTIIVLHPGSSLLQLGRATDHFPQMVPHVIANLRADDAESNMEEKNSLMREGISDPGSENKRLLAVQSTNQLINAMRVSFGYRRPHISNAQIASFNSKVMPETIQGESGVCWTDVSENPKVLIGEQAQYLDPNAPYDIIWPIRNGQLNIHDNPGGSLSYVCSKLEMLWSLAIQMYLDIPAKDFQYYRVVLIVTDIFNRRHLKELANIILNRLGFSSIILHQESVCATFGSGLPSACVVDVGDQTTSISCVEDGISIPSSRLTLKFGGSDVTRCFYWLLQRDIPVGQIHEFQVYRPQKSGLLYQIKLGDEPLQAPIALFVPQLFGIVGERLLVSNSDLIEHDPEDLYDDKYLLEVQVREQSTKKGKTEHDFPTDVNERFEMQSIHSSRCSERSTPGTSNFEFDGIGIDQAILYSIGCCGPYETKRKMYSSIIVVGGGMMFKGVNNFLLRRIQAQLPIGFQFMRDQVEIITRPKEMDPRSVCWKGGAVLSILDSAQELWVNHSEFCTYGPRILREKSAFQWSPNLTEKQ